MDLQQLNELDLENIGDWPKLVKGLFILVICLLLSGGIHYYLVVDQMKLLETKQLQEQELRLKFESKAALASNLPAYKAQLAKMNDVFFTLLQQLPASHEIAGLIDELSFLGTDNGLKFRTIRWEAEVDQEFSTELPLQIIVEGEYDQLGGFVSDVAGLPRIVILDNIQLTRSTDEDAKLVMSMMAKTYRYKEGK
jgi:type IV pilus assembly protein PilO